MKRLHLLIMGNVQGVTFRHTSQKMARSLGLTGWIRNVGVNRLECEVQGEELFLHQFVLFVLRGPRFAEVERIEIEYKAPKKEEKEFAIVATV